MSHDLDRRRPEARCSPVGTTDNRSREGPLFRRVIERNVAVWYLGSLCAAFLAGFSTYHYMQEASGMEPISRVEHEVMFDTNTRLRDELEKVMAERDALLETLTKMQSTALGVPSAETPAAVGRHRRQRKATGLASGEIAREN